MLRAIAKVFTRLFRKDTTAIKLVSFSGNSEHLDLVWDEYNMETLWNWLVHRTNPNKKNGNLELFQQVMEAKRHKDYYTLMMIASTFGVRFKYEAEEV
jgi:hypothetical protein